MRRNKYLLRKSIAASHGTLLGNDFHFDMVRPGIGLYGGIKNSGLEKVIQIKVPVLQNFIIDKIYILYFIYITIYIR